MIRKIIIHKEILLIEDYEGENLISTIEIRITKKLSDYLSDSITEMIVNTCYK